MKRTPAGLKILVWLMPAIIAAADVKLGKDAPPPPTVREFDLAPDDKRFVFSGTTGAGSAIGISESDGSEYRALAWSQDETYSVPRFSPDGAKIIYLAYPAKIKENEKPKSRVVEMRVDGTGQRELIPAKAHITEAVYASSGDSILFLRADEFRSDSPVAQPRPHRFDVYSQKIGGGEPLRLSQFAAFEMSHLALFPTPGKIAFKMAGSLQNGIYSFDTARANSEELISPRSVPVPDNVIDSELSHDGKLLAFVSPAKVRGPYRYELYVTNLSTSKTTQITSFNRFVHNVRFYRKSPKLSFLYEPNYPEVSGPRELMEVGLDGSNPRPLNKPRQQ